MTATFISLVALGLLSALCYAGLWLGTPPDGPAVPRFLALIAAAFVLYAAACTVARRAAPRTSLPTVLVGAVAFRLIMISGPVLYDNDLYRYHWDGRVLASGRNPYSYAPGDHRLARLRDEAWERVDFKWVKTIYPPLAIALSAASSLVWISPHRIRLLALVFDLATLLPILLILARLRLPRALVIVYAWNPLPIKEFANSGHLDSIAIFFATWALYLLISRQALRAGLLWALSFLSKTWTALLFPLFLHRRSIVAILMFAAVVLIGLLPFARAGKDLFAGSRAYASHWEFNSGPFAVVKAAADRIGLDGMRAARALNAAIWLLFAALVAASREGSEPEALRRAGLLVAVALVLSPVCDPWYVCWLLPVLCVHRSPAFLAFTGLVMLAYVYYHDQALDPPARILEYGTLAALLAWEQLARSKHRLWAGLTVTRGVSPHSP